jgi:hypothetical protein
LPESSPESIAQPPTLRTRLIRRIAEALGRPETAFLDEAGSGFCADQGELLRLWNSLTDPADRQRVLDYARHVASKCSGTVRP